MVEDADVVSKIISDFPGYAKKRKVIAKRNRVLTALFRKDAEVWQFVQQGKTLDEIQRFIIRREQKPQFQVFNRPIESPLSDQEILFAIRRPFSETKLLGYEANMNDEQILAKLRNRPDDMNTLESYIKSQRKIWYEPEQTSEVTN